VHRKSLIFTIALALLLGTAGTWEWKRIRDASLIQRCEFRGASGTYELSPEQTGNAATIAAVANRRGLPKRATTVALSAALQESKLMSLDYGDRDSVGLFQQRPSQGWGPRKSLLDPVYASNKFFTALIRNSDWQRMSIADAAQAVQRSAAGSAYAAWESEARVMSEALNTDPYSLTCYLHRYSNPVDALSNRKSALADELKHVFGISNLANVNSQGLSVVVSGETNARVAGWLMSHADEYGVATVDANQHFWSRREWQHSSYNLWQITVHFL
jgi:hypothetical protein